jgi:1,4-alpha-glucan branching enzyme
MQVYEVHLGSWRAFDGGVSYRAIADPLATYARENGFTHVELLPVMEHPFYGSWGYQVTGFFAPTARYGTPDDLRFLIDTLHQAGIAVILDWVPAHFPADAHALGQFDGTHLFEHADPRRGWHPDWNTYIFNYERNEVRSFLLSSATYWLDQFHADGLRVDAVASMLYRDYSRAEGEWVPNADGGRENHAAVSLLQQINETVYRAFPGIAMIAEESTAWPGVSRPTSSGGLGFGMKWDMGWMHDTLRYLEREPVHRTFHHDEITFRAVYAFSENYVLALSHDEVVHGKGSLFDKVPGDEWQRAATLRLLFGLQAAQPGKSLLFMGMEFGQRREWSHERTLDWDLLEHPAHAGILAWVRDVNHVVQQIPALHERDGEPNGTRWLALDDRARSVLTWARFADDGSPVVAVCNFTPVARHAHRVGLPIAGDWVERLNSDDLRYGGSGLVFGELRTSAPIPAMGCADSVEILVPPLGVVLLQPVP